MKRILLMVFRNIILVPYMWCRLCYHASHTEKYTEEEQYSLLKFIVLRANKGGNVRIEPYGTEIFLKKVDSCFFQTIRVFTMCLPSWRPAQCPFQWSQRRKFRTFSF